MIQDADELAETLHGRIATRESPGVSKLEVFSLLFGYRQSLYIGCRKCKSGELA